jgi:integrase
VSDHNGADHAPAKPNVALASSPHASQAVAPCAVALTLQHAAERAQFYVGQARADRTRLAYEQDFRAFERWCAASSLCALPATPETLVLYLTALIDGGRKVSTVKRARVAIGRAHAAAHLPRPDRTEQIRELERGMGRVHAAKEDGAPPLLHEDIIRITKTLGSAVRDDRDRALLLLGFWGAFRACELVALRIEDVTLEPAHVRIVVRHNQEHQLRDGEVVTIEASTQPELCAVRAVRGWIERVGQSSGPLLRQVHGGHLAVVGMQPRAVSRAVRRLAIRAGLGPRYTAHSLRAGLATSAYARGVSERQIQQHGRWKDRRSLDRYIHPVAFAAPPNVVTAFN